MENSRNKQFIIFKSHIILSSIRKYHAFPLCPGWDVNHPFVQHIYIAYATCHLVAILVIRSTMWHPSACVFKVTLISSLNYIMMPT